MKDLGKLQSSLMAQLRKATEAGDGNTLGRLGPIAADMEKKAREWSSIIDPPSNGSPLLNAVPVEPSGGGLDSRSFAGKRIYSVTIIDSKVPVGSYKDAFQCVIERLQSIHDNFDQLAPNVRGRFPYFSDDPKKLRKPKQLQRSNLYFETNIGADRIWEICCRLVRTFGYDPGQPGVLSFETDSTRTRARGRRRRKPYEEL